jgi:translation initiation factor 3 subunit K
MSSPQIKTLLQGVGRYDINILPDLQAHLEEQLKTGTYDIDANLALLKLFLLHPQEQSKETRIEIMERVLLKSLMAYPAADFSLCMYQIPLMYHNHLKDVLNLAQWLELAKFTKFWKDAETVETLKQAVGWQTAVRNFIAGVISSTYRSIKVDQLAELLNLPAADMEPIINERGWTRSKDDKQVVVVNTAGFVTVRPEPKAASTTMSLEQYRTLYMASTGA